MKPRQSSYEGCLFLSMTIMHFDEWIQFKKDYENADDIELDNRFGMLKDQLGPFWLRMIEDWKEDRVTLLKDWQISHDIFIKRVKELTDELSEANKEIEYLEEKIDFNRKGISKWE